VSFLLDTNVVSELRKLYPHPKVRAWHRANAHAEVFLSALVVGELRQGVERLRVRDGGRADTLETWLGGLVGAYGDRILPVTTEVAQQWGRLNATVRPPVIDGLLAATALVHQLTLVTRNVADVARTGVAVVNPFTVTS
jgi:toxin FitB